MTTTATSPSDPVGRAWTLRSDAAGRGPLAAGPAPDAHPRHHHLHRPGRLRHRRARGRPRRDPLHPRPPPRRDAHPRHRVPVPAEPGGAERHRCGRGRPRPRDVHRAARRGGGGQGHVARPPAADDRRVEPRSARLPAPALAPPHRVRASTPAAARCSTPATGSRRAACSGSPHRRWPRRRTSPPTWRRRATRCCSPATGRCATTMRSTPSGASSWPTTARRTRSPGRWCSWRTLAPSARSSSAPSSSRRCTCASPMRRSTGRTRDGVVG